MKTVGIFEAKTAFTALCEEVVRTGLPTMVQKRGRPLVMVSPVPPTLAAGREDILSAWKGWKSRRVEGDFPEVWKMRGATARNPLGD